ncbi:MAG: PSD1 and planctomycete cytochrome C domain-containing protein [Aureliella sp.]
MLSHANTATRCHLSYPLVVGCRILALTLVIGFVFPLAAQETEVESNAAPINQPQTVLAADAIADDTVDDQAVAYFETHIRPLFAQRCYQCHSERAGEPEGDLLLDRRSGWLEGGVRGPSIIPGDVEASLLVQAIRFSQADLEMPPSEPLSQDEIHRIEQWVRMGAPGPRDGQAVTNVDPSDPIAGKQHWAFQPLTRPAAPQLNNKAWPNGAIDRFVLARLEQTGLQPAPDATLGQFRRRLAFQLTGLPARDGDYASGSPSEDLPAADVEGWQQTKSEWVDRMIGSPEFGRRWGRHWLDLARYADSNGLDENFLFREAWRYRNWVIDATNADLPYDRFLTEQIAGDLLPYASQVQRDSQRIAAGFLVIGPKVLLGVKDELQRMDIADEQIETVGRTVLGQTLGCARCHDHKFDPVPTADYYALAGIFTSTKVMEKRYMLGEQRSMEQLIGLGAEDNAADDAYEAFWREAPALRKRKSQAETALAALQDAKLDELAAVWQEHPDAVAERAKDESQTLEQRLAAQQQHVEQLAQVLAQAPVIPPRGMIPTEADEPADEAIRLAGQFDALGDTVPRGFLTVLSDQPCTIQDDHSGRLALAHWLTDTHGGAGQLAARVMANRIWQHLIGRGLVRTVDNFGRTGEAPSHPELLDYLACELVDSGWSIKHLVRQIALSRTFAMSSGFDADNYAIDPDNEHLWRGNRRRLEPEAIHDAILVAAGQLDDAQYGSTVDYLGDQATAVGSNPVRRRTDFPCRCVYLPVIRNDLPEIFDAFDFTNPHTTTGARPQTIVPSQGLFMLNDEWVMDAAEKTARSIIAESPTNNVLAQVERLFVRLNVEPPRELERDAVLAFVQHVNATSQQVAEAGRSDDGATDDGAADDGATDDGATELRALALACQAVFASSGFQFIE